VIAGLCWNAAGPDIWLFLLPCGGARRDRPFRLVRDRARVVRSAVVVIALAWRGLSPSADPVLGVRASWLSRSGWREQATRSRAVTGPVRYRGVIGETTPEPRPMRVAHLCRRLYEADGSALFADLCGNRRSRMLADPMLSHISSRISTFREMIESITGEPLKSPRGVAILMDLGGPGTTNPSRSRRPARVGDSRPCLGEPQLTRELTRSVLLDGNAGRIRAASSDPHSSRTNAGDRRLSRYRSMVAQRTHSLARPTAPPS
jgi:hypothetical protein